MLADERVGVDHESVLLSILFLYTDDTKTIGMAKGTKTIGLAKDTKTIVMVKDTKTMHKNYRHGKRTQKLLAW
jgi:hypothetical protein